MLVFNSGTQAKKKMRPWSANSPHPAENAWYEKHLAAKTADNISSRWSADMDQNHAV